MKKIKYALATILAGVVMSGCASTRTTGSGETSKDKIIENGKELRFVSFNIPNLHYNEDNLPFSQTNPWRLPDEFEITDALTSIQQMGGKITRTYVISVKKQGDTPDIIRHVEAPGKFNEEAFRALDKVLEVANKTGVRLIIPLVDNWWWWGGPAEYAAFRGKKAKDFWTDTLLISDFRKTIDYVLNRTNTYTGVKYKDDKAVFAWETGNELQCPYSWTAEIAKYIKSVDKNHLVIDGASYSAFPEEALSDPNTDILTTHHYSPGKQIIESIKKNEALAKGRKPYFVGEFGFISKEEVKAVIDTVLNSNLMGVMIWSLRNRSRDGGFYHHYEKSTYAAYHWPGFESGSYAEEKDVLNIMREAAFRADGLEAPAVPVPAKPNMLNIDDVYSISWQGSTGASSYILERKAEDEAGWKVIAEGIDEAANPYRAIYSDASAVPGKSYSYRVKAVNTSGISEASDPAGPVRVEYRKLTDEMMNEKLMHSKQGEFEFMTVKDVRRAKEDPHRLAGRQGSSVVYSVEQPIETFSADVFSEKPELNMQFQVSGDGVNFVSLQCNKEVFDAGKNDYGFFAPVRYSASEIPQGIRYLKITFGDGVQQLAHVEIKYGSINLAIK